MKRKKITFSVVGKCWECTSHATNDSGYPVYSFNGKTITISRYIYLKKQVEIPKGHVIRHTCDNRLCINPKHLIIGTHADNVKDRVLRGRSAIGVRNGRSKLKESQVLEIFYSTAPIIHIAKEYKVDPKLVRQIKNKVLWRSVTSEL